MKSGSKKIMKYVSKFALVALISWVLTSVISNVFVVKSGFTVFVLCFCALYMFGHTLLLRWSKSTKQASRKDDSDSFKLRSVLSSRKNEYAFIVCIQPEWKEIEKFIRPTGYPKNRSFVEDKLKEIYKNKKKYPEEMLWNKRFDFLIIKRKNEDEIIWNLYTEEIIPTYESRRGFYIREHIEGSTIFPQVYKDAILISPDSIAFDVGFMDTRPKILSSVPFLEVKNFILEQDDDVYDDDYDGKAGLAVPAHIKQKLEELKVSFKESYGRYDLKAKYFSVYIEQLPIHSFALGIPKFYRNWEQKVQEWKVEKEKLLKINTKRKIGRKSSTSNKKSG